MVEFMKKEQKKEEEKQEIGILGKPIVYVRLGEDPNYS